MSIPSAKYNANSTLNVLKAHYITFIVSDADLQRDWRSTMTGSVKFILFSIQTMIQLLFLPAASFFQRAGLVGFSLLLLFFITSRALHNWNLEIFRFAAKFLPQNSNARSSFVAKISPPPQTYAPLAPVPLFFLAFCFHSVSARDFASGPVSHFNPTYLLDRASSIPLH